MAKLKIHYLISSKTSETRRILPLASYFIILIGIGLIAGTYIANKAGGKKTKTPADTSSPTTVKGCS